MLFLTHLIARALARLLAGSKGEGEKDLEILVLRHQLKVLRRTRATSTLRGFDRAVLSAVAKVLPPRCWASFMVTPKTLLRWHRELVQRKWTYAKGRSPGRPPLDPDILELILRIGKENPRWGA